MFQYICLAFFGVYALVYGTLTKQGAFLQHYEPIKLWIKLEVIFLEAFLNHDSYPRAPHHKCSAVPGELSSNFTVSEKPYI